MIRRKKIPRQQKHNYGYGHQLCFAFCQALDAFYGKHDHYGTRRGHKKRIRIFAAFCRRHGIRDARDITQDTLVAYGQYLRERLGQDYLWENGDKDRQISIAYSHNLLSTANTALLAIRGDDRLKISAKEALGTSRSFVRKTPIQADLSDVQMAVDRLIARGEQRAAAVVLLCRAWGMRVREALLQDLPRMAKEVAEGESATILEGTKGGRRCPTRTIEADEYRREALGFALSVKPKGSRCLLSETDNVRHFLQTTLQRARRVLRDCGIPSYRELRAGFAEDCYENITGGSSPLKSPILDEALDRHARAEVARMLGHSRPQVANSYIGGY